MVVGKLIDVVEVYYLLMENSLEYCFLDIEIAYCIHFIVMITNRV